jgi:hypothetical protein
VDGKGNLPIVFAQRPGPIVRLCFLRNFAHRQWTKSILKRVGMPIPFNGQQFWNNALSVDCLKLNIGTVSFFDPDEVLPVT